jgi:hypothetical protein
MVRSCCPPSDADAILAIKLPQRQCDDFVAWFPEKNGIFSVRSAYRLGLQPSLDLLSEGQSSAEPGGDRGIWNLVWKAKVPQKLRVFAWKAATSTLAVRSGLHHRIPKIDPTCIICGLEVEDGHHALIRCTLARALREEMRKIWTLPPESAFQINSKEWLLHLLSTSSPSIRAKIIFLLWRSWHLRNNIVHGDGKASIVASASFIANYLESFSSVNLARSDPKGKAAVSPEHQLPESSVRLSNWTTPTEGQLKENVDAGWDVSTKKAGIGVIIRGHLGQVVECEWKFISWCASAEEAEVLACLQGLKSLIRLQAPYGILESDCLRTVKILQCEVKDTSSCWSLYAEGHELLNLYQSISICKVDRASNGLAHGLAQLGKKGDSGSARGSVPPPLAGLAEKDCNWVDEPLGA